MRQCTSAHESREDGHEQRRAAGDGGQPGKGADGKFPLLSLLFASNALDDRIGCFGRGGWLDPTQSAQLLDHTFEGGESRLAVPAKDKAGAAAGASAGVEERGEGS